MNAPVGAPRNEGLLFGLPLLGVYAVAVVAFFATMRSEALNALVTSSLLLGLAAISAAASFYRLRQGREVHKQWLFFALSGLCATASHIVWSFGLPAELGSWLLLGSPVAFAAATAIALQDHDRGKAFEVSLDTALVVGAAAIVVFRWAPAAQQVLQAGVDFSLANRASVIVASVTGIASLFFALIPLTESAGATSIGIAGAAISFALASMPLALEGSDCCNGGNPLALAAASGWVSLTYGALRHDAPTTRQRTAVGWRMRYLIAPGVAVLMAAVLVDAALGPPLLKISSVAMGATGLVLSLRLTQLLQMSGRRTREQLELAQTRALIQVSNALASETDLNATLGEVTVVTCRLLNGRAATLELLTDDSRALEVKAAVGLPPEVIGLRVPVIGSFTGSIIRDGESRMVVDPSADDQFSEESRRWLGHSPTAGAPLRHRGQPLGVLSVMGEEPFGPDDLELLSALADQASVAIANARLFQQVHALSITDPLTGLANRRQLERDLAREFAAAKRGRQLVAVMFDVNGFKTYNDQHGHLAGDQVLRALGDALATHTRAMNLAARYGGDEFVVLLADAEPHGARIFVQRVRQGFDHAIASLGRGGVTIGAGMAAYHPEMTDPEQLIAAADAALYEAKGVRSST